MIYNLRTLSIFSSGVVSIDVVLSDIDINQCDDQQETSYSAGEDNLMEFMGTHLCKPSTKVMISTIIIQQIVTMPIYGKEALNIRQPT